MYKFKNQSKAILLFNIAFNLLLLIYYKYFYFILDIISVEYKFEKIGISNQNIIPLGISFFTFTQIGFILDAYEKKCERINFKKYFLFVTFFPHLVAGPLLKHSTFFPQLNTDLSRNQSHNIYYGLCIFAIGLFKKLIIADTFGSYANSLFDLADSRNLDFFSAWGACFSYTFQLYFDFSGYSDMAIGISMLFGLYIPINFNSPFKSCNVIDFWQRWHISLTSFIQNYLYNPLLLTINRVAINNLKFNYSIITFVIPTIIIFAIIGLWHGASYNFVLFGIFHGLFISINQLWRKYKFLRNFKDTFFYKFISWFITFIAVSASFVIFRSNTINTAEFIYQAMFIPKIVNFDFSPLGFFILLAILFVLLAPNVNYFIKDSNIIINNKFLNSRLAPAFIPFLFIISLLQIYRTIPFLYFNF
jgi:D-alanyl-lipoteichoic acid acyltransferase DltB (MBOAT superfamily)